MIKTLRVRALRAERATPWPSRFRAARAVRACALVALLAGGGGAPARGALGNAPEDEYRRFKVAPGFEVNLFASEADGVVKPIQMRWDERGRLWVIGTKTYPQIKPGEQPNDQVLILEDTDRDGKVDKTTVFADGLMVPTGLEIAPGPGNACYVGEGTRLWLMTDTDGDGRSDWREVVLRGFGTGDSHQNINSFHWSPGGELMFCQGLHGFARVETPWGVTQLNQAGLWRLRPREQRLDAFYGGPADPQNPWGWVFTHWGEPIVVAGNSGTMYYPAPEMIRGFNGGRRTPIWGQGRGRKTSNPEIIESAHFPPEWQGVLLPGGYINNSVWALAVERDGSGLKVSDHPTLPPIIQSSHGSFRPIDVKLGPDGALYVLDWYNPIIGHYQVSFRHPDRDKAHGRIWRITAKGRPLLTPPKIAGATLPELCELLRAPDRWPRQQAKRVLFGGDTAQVTTALRAWWPRLDPKSPDGEYAALQALGVFEAHETVELGLLQRVLSSQRPEARAYAANTIARWADRLPPGFDAVAELQRLAGDAEAPVRLAAIVAAGNIPRAESIQVVLRAAEHPRDPFIEIALRAAVAVLKPWWEPALARGSTEWKPERVELIRGLDKPRAAPAARPVAQKNAKPIVPVYGETRATPFLTGVIAAEVLTKGDAQRGAEIFRRPELTCVACHRVGNTGGEVGPALDAVGSAQPLELIIGMVIEPQREIKEGFEAVQITTKKGETIVGVVVAGNGAELTVRDPAGKEHVVAEADITQRDSIGSLMPAGLTDRLSREDLRDLFAYLTELGKTK